MEVTSFFIAQSRLVMLSSEKTEEFYSFISFVIFLVSEIAIHCFNKHKEVFKYKKKSNKN